MRRTLPGLLSRFSLVALFLAFAVMIGRTADVELDQYEDRAVARSSERAVRMLKSDRVLWIKELENAFPGRVTNATTEEEYATWFTLVAGKGEEWRKDSCPNTQIAELFDKVVQRLELGPVPSIKRDEFARYARRSLMPGNPQPQGGNGAPDPNEDADKMFRILDRDGNSMLDKEELTTRLRDDRIRSDADGNGRIDKDEYRQYYQRRITVYVELAGGKTGDKSGRGPDGKMTSSAAKAGIGLPEWFTTFDNDEDGQIALFEWRKGGRSIETFGEMDLDEDGLLTREEYLRFVKKNEAETAKNTNVPPMGKQVKK